MPANAGSVFIIVLFGVANGIELRLHRIEKIKRLSKVNQDTFMLYCNTNMMMVNKIIVCTCLGLVIRN